MVPSGGRTGLAGAATATDGELVLSMERMRRILDVDATARTLRCEAGATVEAVQRAASEHDLVYPVDFAAKGSAQIGGSIATNAGGVNVLRYGLTRQWIMGLGVVLASAEFVRLGGALVKNNTGYDLRQLFIGSEGTLGVIVEATLGLTKPPLDHVVMLCGTGGDEQVMSLFTRLRAAPVTLSAFESFDAGCLMHVLAHRDGRPPLSQACSRYVLAEIEIVSAGVVVDVRRTVVDALAAASEIGEIDDAVLADSNAQQHELWAYREDISESLHQHRPYKADIALPVARVPEFLLRWRSELARMLPDVEALVFGHIGDGNLHLNLLPPETMDQHTFLEAVEPVAEWTYALVSEHGGSISAEHGIGLLKRPHLHYSRTATEIELMRAIKRALDPDGLFNPGKVFT